MCVYVFESQYNTVSYGMYRYAYIDITTNTSQEVGISLLESDSDQNLTNIYQTGGWTFKFE